MKLIYKFLIPIFFIFIFSFLFLLNEFVNSEKNVVNILKDSAKQELLEQLQNRKKSQLEIEKEYISFIADMIAKVSANYLLLYDENGMKYSLNSFLQIKSVIAICIYDTVTNENFMTLYKDKDNINTTKEIPVFLKDLQKIERQLYINEKLGIAYIYYDNTDIKNEIKKAEKSVENRVNSFSSVVETKIDETIKRQSLFIIFIAILMSISFIVLVYYFIQVPLKKVKNGLDDFFEFLQNKKDSAKNIELNSNDEFGHMAMSLNENIKVSAKLHQEIKKFNNELELLVEERTNSLQKAHTQIRDSIGYASFIQSALIPEIALFKEAFCDFFVLLNQRDMIGGDIYLFDKLDRGKEEYILMVIDCTGHGVSGAFVTMLVKAIERQIIANINKSEDEVSTAKILSTFNQTIKNLLKQYNKNAISNVGFDGGIVYINKTDKILRYSGSQTPLFIQNYDNIEILKGDKHSVGYIKSRYDYKFKEYIYNIENDMKIYIATDGYFDQTGGDKGFCFSKKRFKNLIEENHYKSFDKQKMIFVNSLKDYMKTQEQKDDITVIGIKL